jgi:hypothetical protein
MRRFTQVRSVLFALTLVSTSACTLGDAGTTDSGFGDRGGSGGQLGEGGTSLPQGGNGGAGGAIVPDAPPGFDDGDAVLAYLVQLVAACPMVSRSTVPGGWDVHALKDAACSQWTPAGWLESEDLATKSFLADAQGTTGYMTIATQVAGTNWTVESLTQLVIDDLTAQYPDLAVLHARTEPDSFGLGYQIRSVVMKYTHAGHPTVATLSMVHSECSVILNNCLLTGMGSWTPLSELATWVCVLRQVDASVYCPGGGGSGDCSDSDCNAQCVAEGNESGGCVGDDCQCR